MICRARAFKFFMITVTDTVHVARRRRGEWTRIMIIRIPLALFNLKLNGGARSRPPAAPAAARRRGTGNRNAQAGDQCRAP